MIFYFLSMRCLSFFWNQESLSLFGAFVSQMCGWGWIICILSLRSQRVLWIIFTLWSTVLSDFVQTFWVSSVRPPKLSQLWVNTNNYGIYAFYPTIFSMKIQTLLHFVWIYIYLSYLKDILIWIYTWLFTSCSLQILLISVCN